MSFCLDTREVKYLHNYAAALKHHDDVKPISNSNCRPIAGRRKKHFNIRKQGETIIVRLYSTDIVTYTPDNRVTLDMGGWHSVSTRAAIGAVTGVSTTQKHGCSWVQDHDGKHYLFKDGMQLGVQGYRENKIIDPIYPVIHTLNRKAFNQKLRQFKDYYNYMLGVAKVDGWRGHGLVAHSRGHGLVAHSLVYVPQMVERHVLDALTNPDNYKNGMFNPEPETAFNLSKALMSDYYLTFFVDHHNPNYNPIAGLNLESFISTALKRAIIKTHKDDLLKKETIKDGRIVKDQYGWV